MVGRIVGVVGIAVLVCSVAGSALAQEKKGSDGLVSIGVSPIGFTPTPTTYLFGFDAMLHFNERWAAGTVLQVGPRTGFTLLSFSVNGRYYFEFLDGTFLDGLEPYATIGLGVGVGFPRNLPSNSEFLANMGMGAEYPITEHVYFGSSMLFNIMPGAAANSFVYSWQFAQVRYRF